MRYTSLAIKDPNDLVFGRAPKPVSCGFGLAIGDGLVFPEVNFTLPVLSKKDKAEVLGQYQEMIEAVLRRAKALRVPGIVIEFEHLPSMTEKPRLGAEITLLIHNELKKFHESSGIPCALRVTVVDLRDKIRPPRLRQGKTWEVMKQSFELSRDRGAHILSIESIGGKEVSDQAIIQGDIRGVIFALGVLGARDMAWLWDNIVSICKDREGVIPGGDAACAFANTAMQLAGLRHLQETFAAVVRAVGAVRSLVAYEHGAIGPSKDCAYEGPILKAITGCPISMEGKSSACAHFSYMGNITAAACDLWSNESVQNIRLLSGNAPEIFTEILAYDCRLMNEALKQGEEKRLRDWFVSSDCYSSPQALVISPESSVEIAKAIISEKSDYGRAVAAACQAVKIIRSSHEQGKLNLPSPEIRCLDGIAKDLEELPPEEEKFIKSMMSEYRRLILPGSYGL